MRSIQIEGTKRSELGKGHTRQLRSEGKIPAVIYGGSEIINFSTTPLALRKLIYTPDFQLAEITVDGNNHSCILKDVQFDVITDEVIHVDFLELVEGKKVIADLPLKFVGQPEGVKAGGRFNVKAKTLRVRTYPKYLKEFIEVNVSSLNIGENIRVEDVNAENMEVMNSPRIPIASVVTTRALRQAETEAAKADKK